MQRASYRADAWQFVVCSPEPVLRKFLDSLAANQPGGKTVTVVECEAYDPSLPAAIFGMHLPPTLKTDLNKVLLEKPIAYSDGDLILLNNYLVNGEQADRPGSTVTLYLSTREGAVMNHLTNATLSGWGGVLRLRWAYEKIQADGRRIMGDFAGEGWAFASEHTIDLPPIPPPISILDGIAYYSVDGAITKGELIDIMLTDSMAFSVDPMVKSIYLYPSVERIGLRRGKMGALQLEGKDVHMVYDRNRGADGLVATQIPDFLKGMTFAHEGYRVYNGYGGSTVGPALDSLSKLAVNALAIVPYTFMRAPDQTGELPVPDGAGSENDAAVVYSIRQAHARNWVVLLKPQIWVGGAWPGEVDFSTEPEWQDFFDKYTDWIEHYALMAEAEGVAALCIGTELVHATLDHPDRWRTLIAGVRKIYSGKLTYAANWGREFEELSFWKSLDAVGLNSYYPLSQDLDATDAELVSGAREWMQTADSISLRAGRPLWLTEVGFRSVQYAWVNPHAEAADRRVDYRAQQRCYAALFAAADEATNLKGVFIWKWPSHLGYLDRRGADTGYVPGGKPAGAVVRQYYEGL